jgi:chromosome segregation ATPase
MENTHNEHREIEQKLSEARNTVKVLLWVIGILFLVLLISDSNVDEKNRQIEKHWNSVVAIQAKIDQLDDAIDDLDSESGNFDDGLTDWKEIVPKIKDATNEVDERLGEIKSDVDNLEDKMRPPPPPEESRDDY